MYRLRPEAERGAFTGQVRGARAEARSRSRAGSDSTICEPGRAMPSSSAIWRQKARLWTDAAIVGEGEGRVQRRSVRGSPPSLSDFLGETAPQAKVASAGGRASSGPDPRMGGRSHG